MMTLVVAWRRTNDLILWSICRSVEWGGKEERLERNNPQTARENPFGWHFWVRAPLQPQGLSPMAELPRASRFFVSPRSPDFQDPLVILPEHSGQITVILQSPPGIFRCSLLSSVCFQSPRGREENWLSTPIFNGKTSTPRTQELIIRHVSTFNQP